MTKLYISNENAVEGVTIRIYPLTEKSQVIVPESFKPMDTMGVSFATALTAKPEQKCEGILNRAGVVEISDAQEFEVQLPDGTKLTTNNVDDFVDILRDNGFTVDEVEDYVPDSGSEITCDGGTNILTFEDLGFGDLNFEGAEYDILITIEASKTDKIAFTCDVLNNYLDDAAEAHADVRLWIEQHGIVVKGGIRSSIINNGPGHVRLTMERTNVAGEVADFTLGQVYQNLSTGAGTFENENKYVACLTNEGSDGGLISCAGALSFIKVPGDIRLIGDSATIEVTKTFRSESEEETQVITIPFQRDGDYFPSLAEVLDDANEGYGVLEGLTLVTDSSDFDLSITGMYGANYWRDLESVRLTVKGPNNRTIEMSSSVLSDPTAPTLYVENEGTEDRFGEVGFCLTANTIQNIICEGEESFIDFPSILSLNGNYVVSVAVSAGTGDGIIVEEKTITGFANDYTPFTDLIDGNPQWPYDAVGLGEYRFDALLDNSTVRISIRSTNIFIGDEISGSSYSLENHVGYQTLEFCLTKAAKAVISCADAQDFVSFANQFIVNGFYKIEVENTFNGEVIKSELEDVFERQSLVWLLNNHPNANSLDLKAENDYNPRFTAKLPGETRVRITSARIENTGASSGSYVNVTDTEMTFCLTKAERHVISCSGQTDHISYNGELSALGNWMFEIEKTIDGVTTIEYLNGYSDPKEDLATAISTNWNLQASGLTVELGETKTISVKTPGEYRIRITGTEVTSSLPEAFSGSDVGWYDGAFCFCLTLKAPISCVGESDNVTFLSQLKVTGDFKTTVEKTLRGNKTTVVTEGNAPVTANLAYYHSNDQVLKDFGLHVLYETQPKWFIEKSGDYRVKIEADSISFTGVPAGSTVVQEGNTIEFCLTLFTPEISPIAANQPVSATGPLNKAARVYINDKLYNYPAQLADIQKLVNLNWVSASGGNVHQWTNRTLEPLTVSIYEEGGSNFSDGNWQNHLGDKSYAFASDSSYVVFNLAPVPTTRLTNQNIDHTARSAMIISREYSLALPPKSMVYINLGEQTYTYETLDELSCANAIANAVAAHDIPKTSLSAQSIGFDTISLGYHNPVGTEAIVTIVSASPLNGPVVNGLTIIPTNEATELEFSNIIYRFKLRRTEANFISCYDATEEVHVGNLGRVYVVMVDGCLYVRSSGTSGLTPTPPEFWYDNSVSSEDGVITNRSSQPMQIGIITFDPLNATDPGWSNNTNPTIITDLQEGYIMACIASFTG